jgi:alanyl-tRNA synthetase
MMIEAFDIWHKTIGIPAKRIMRFGEKDNFWGPAVLRAPAAPAANCI